MKRQPLTKGTIQALKSFAHEAKRITMAPLNDAMKKFDETGSAILGRGDNLRLIIKDEGDFIIVGLDTDTLVSTDIKLPSRTFATKEEAFAAVKQLQDSLSIKGA